jgi:hypothetical protein
MPFSAVNGATPKTADRVAGPVYQATSARYVTTALTRPKPTTITNRPFSVDEIGGFPKPHDLHRNH